MNRLSIITIIAAVILVGVTIQHQALASIWSDTLARAQQYMRSRGKIPQSTL
jgi:hypothetical protein